MAAAASAVPQVAAEVAQPTVKAVQPSVAGPGAAVVDSSEERRRRAQLRAIRDELCALQVILEHPISTGREGAAKPEAPRPQAMRPRLVLEPKPPAAPVERLRLVGDARGQGDLFAIE